MNYKVVNYTSNIAPPHIQFADVLEVPTKLTIKANIPTIEARALCKHLNSGGGFNGLTPEFFLKSIPPIQWPSNEIS